MTGCSQSIWDITALELKEAWRQGREELFYPYGRTQVQTLVGQRGHPRARCGARSVRSGPPKRPDKKDGNGSNTPARTGRI
jgi:hypothetical protein